MLAYYVPLPLPVKQIWKEGTCQVHQEICSQLHWSHHSRMKHIALRVLGGWNCSVYPTEAAISVSSHTSPTTYVLIFSQMQESTLVDELPRRTFKVFPPPLLIRESIPIKLGILWIILWSHDSMCCRFKGTAEGRSILKNLIIPYIEDRGQEWSI